MSMERIEKIYEEMIDNDYEIVDNNVFLGLEILNKYAEKEVSINPAHDEIYAGIKDEEYEKMTDEDIKKMFELNWRWEDTCFTIFT